MPLSIGNDSESTPRIHMRTERIASETRCAKRQFTDSLPPSAVAICVFPEYAIDLW